MGFVSGRTHKTKTHLTPLDGKSCLAITLIDKELHRIILSSGLLLSSLAILAPVASGRQCGYSPTNLFDPIPTGVPYRRAYFDRNVANRDRVEFSHDNTSTTTLDPNCEPESPATSGNNGNDPGEDSKVQPPERLPASRPPDFNRDIYYKNRLEFSLDGGWLPINIPLPFDVFSGDAYNTYPLKYTLVPIIASLRWHMNGIGGPWFLRGNFDFQFSGSVTAIPRGPETRYFIYIMGMRRNFVPRNSRVAPYFDIRLGMGNIDAKGPIGVYYAQGQDLTFTFNFGSGVRYNFNSRYAISAGVNYMHISNANLSQGGGYTNYGINVLGPMVGIDVQLRRHRRHSAE